MTLVTKEDADTAIEKLNGKELDGRPLRVEVAKPKEKKVVESHNVEDAGEEADEGAPQKRAPGRGRRGRGSRGRGRGGARVAEGSARPPTQPSTTVAHAGNLPFSITDEDLKEHFKDFKVKSATVQKKLRGRSKGYGFVEFETEAELQRAVETMDQSVIDGRKITVKVALVPINKPAAEESA